MLVDTKGAVTSTGNVKDGRIIPSGFAATAGTPHYLLTIRMSEEKNAATQVEIDPAYQQTPDRIPVSAADKRGIIDPMSSFIMPVPGTGDLLGPAACDRTLPLFDGGVRFNINLSFKRLQQVATPAYTGPVAVCGVRYQPISGYRPDRPVNKFMVDNKDMEVWLAPVGKTRFVYPPPPRRDEHDRHGDHRRHRGRDRRARDGRDRALTDDAPGCAQAAP